MEHANHATGATTLLFLLIVLAVIFMFVQGARRALASTGSNQWLLVVVGVLIATVVIPGVLASAGKLDRYNPLPAPALLIVALTTVLTVVVAFSSIGKAFATNISLASLVWFQLFRLPVEMCLHRLYVENVIPIQMTYAGRNFDIVTAVTAAVVAIMLARGMASRTLVLAWNVLGLALLVNIVVVAILCTPVAFRAFTTGPANLLPSTFPFVWLPTLLVQAGLFGHIVVFRSLRKSAV